MSISRRNFLQYCLGSAAALYLSTSEVKRLEAALTTGTPTVIWLHGSGCQGDSVSFLNRIDAAAPAGQRTADDILINSINLAYHSVVMSSSGETAVTMVQQARRKGGYVLVVEGGIPRAFNGNACQLWTYNGQTVTAQAAVADLAAGAAAILAVGTCAAFGGIPRAGANPTDVISVSECTAKQVINIAGCPAHPDWIAWTVVQLILGQMPALDAFNRPTALYGGIVHDNCPRNQGPGVNLATTFGQDGKCLMDLGCRGPHTYSDCPSRKWNNGVNWCVDANAMCIGCTQPDFPGQEFYL